ncbi:GH32 C-terminal domain-containing protein [Rhizobium mongolense]|uniref:beta-fructofuranosidase n=1 Tax=Rhizobium mongolense USDA 1844 TaxID=1079460 RepID=A0A559TDR1_9HYPH|nr:GH32 C-terminal domain-containing protein [Rhizobium mongolense]TVZ72748.1 beta-fructofuranosidase [Rhizobium mongolense USDA 1844]
MTIQTGSFSGSRENVSADLQAGDVIHVWLKARITGVTASVAVTVEGVEITAAVSTKTEEFEFQQVVLSASGKCVLSYEPSATAVSVIYSFDPVGVLEGGIRVLHCSEENAPPQLHSGYHFRPPFGWMNDPNGFGRFGGKAHLFYQHYPHSLRWNTMHWGHAASHDYLHWTHLPVFLFPAAELSARDDGRGGAFSGSAIPVATEDGEGEQIRVFFTEQVRDRRPEEQIQLSAICADGIFVGNPSVVLPVRPERLGLTLDFRDPYVFKGPDGLWKMLLGSRDKSGGVILLYETSGHAAAGDWSFVGVLHREDRFGMTAAECPCMIPLGDVASDETRWALIFGLLTSRDPATGRRNMSSVTVGRFDGRQFQPEFEQELDFGSDAYAFQAFVDHDGPVGLAWLANWTDVSKSVDFPTAMTLPRRILLDGGAVLTPPLEAVDGLRHKLLDEDRLQTGKSVELVDGAVEILLDLKQAGASFELNFDHPEIRLGVRQDKDGLAILFDAGAGKPSPRYLAAGAKPEQVRIFVDAGSIEVFAGNGRWCGTKRIPGFAAIRSASLSASEGSVAAARVWQLKL